MIFSVNTETLYPRDSSNVFVWFGFSLVCSVCDMCVYIWAQVYTQAETTEGCWEFSSVLHLVCETGSLPEPCPLSVLARISG